MKDSHTISLLVADRPGVLVRIALTFARRGFNIDGLVVNRVPGSDLSRITLSSSGDRRASNRSFNSSQNWSTSSVSWITREILRFKIETGLVKVAVDDANRDTVWAAVREFRAEVLDERFGALVVSVHGSSERVSAFVRAIPQAAIREVVSSGKLLVARGMEPT